MGWKVFGSVIVGVSIAITAVGSEGWVHPAELQDERISFLELRPTHRLSPFKELKQYEGAPSRIEDFQGLIQFHKERLEARQKEIQETPIPDRGEGVSLPIETRVSVEHQLVIKPVGDGEEQTEFSDCFDLRPLEPKAILGRLTPQEIGCLEARVTFSRVITEKSKISRVLMANAFASGNGTHVNLLKRHLESIDRSDPDLTYKYAYALSKQGDRNLKDVIYWSDIALERRDKWSSSVYKRRVYTTMKIRANAAYRRWVMAEEAYSSAPISQLNTEKNRRRGEAKTYAREWLEFASAADLDTTSARRMCMSVSGTDAYCH